MQTCHELLKNIFSSLSRKIFSKGTIYKNPAGVPEAFRIANPVAIAESRSWLPSEVLLGRPDQLVVHQNRTPVAGHLDRRSWRDFSALCRIIVQQQPPRSDQR
jgi:hypothetical protein